MSFDPFTLTIIQEHLRATADEMFVRLGQASKSPIIYEVLDYAVALISPKGEIISEAQGVPGFTGVLPFAVLSIVEKFGAQSMKQGDIFATNDPDSNLHFRSRLRFFLDSSPFNMRITDLRCIPVTASISSNSLPFSFLLPFRYRPNILWIYFLLSSTLIGSVSDIVSLSNILDELTRLY
jgi:hypothetical protein